MKKIILLIIVLISLTGCNGLYNLNSFILPDDTEFITLIQRLDTPEKTCQYMLYNFGNEAHVFNTLTPYQLYLNGKGDCDDLSNFATYVANYHGYETYQILIYFSNTIFKHQIAIYEENNGYTFSSNGYYYPVNYNNFYDIVGLNSQDIYEDYSYIWSKYTVYDYDMNVVETGYNK